MGLNTPAIILNDLLHELKGDPDAGRQIAYAVADPGHFDASALGVKVLQAGHSSAMQIVAVGGNTIRRLAGHRDCGASDEDLLRSWADGLGFRLERKGHQPELIQAAKRALRVLKGQGESVRPGNVLGALEAAIKAAEGRS